MEETITIEIICSNGHMFSIGSGVGAKVADIKNYLAGITYVSANDQRLIYKETILDDDQTLHSYGLQEHHVIHVEVLGRDSLFGTTPPSNTSTGKLMEEKEEMILIEIVCTKRAIFSVASSVRSKVADFKNKLARIIDLPANNQRLSYKGIILEDDQTLSSYGLHAIHVEAVQIPSFATTPPSNTPTGLDRDMMSQLIIPTISQMMQSFLSNPQFMKLIVDQNPQLHGMLDSNSQLKETTTGLDRDMMSQLIIPTISQMMQSFLSNPQFMKLIVDQNPQLHGMLDSNSQLKETMLNPQVVCQLQMLQQMMSSPLLPELNQQPPLGILQSGATADDTKLLDGLPEPKKVDHNLEFSGTPDIHLKEDKLAENDINDLPRLADSTIMLPYSDTKPSVPLVEDRNGSRKDKAIDIGEPSNTVQTEQDSAKVTDQGEEAVYSEIKPVTTQNSQPPNLEANISNETETEGRKRNEEAIAKVTNWTISEQINTPLKYLLSEAKASNPIQLSTMIQKDEGKKVRKKTKVSWVPFMCCSSVKAN